LGGGTALIQNNLIANNDFMGIITSVHPHVTVRNNTIADNGFIGYYEFVGAANNIVENNVVARNGFGFPCTVCTATGIVVGPVGLNFISFNDVSTMRRAITRKTRELVSSPTRLQALERFRPIPKFRNAPYGDYGLSLDSPRLMPARIPTRLRETSTVLHGLKMATRMAVPVVDMGHLSARAVN